MALHKLYHPPTQSQNWNMFSLLIPNSVTAFVLVLSATKCLATCDLDPEDWRNQARALSAFVMVFCVVNVLLAMINRVRSGLHSLSVSVRWVPSMLRQSERR